MSEKDAGELVDASGDDYWRGWNAAHDGAYELGEVHKIACALITSGIPAASRDVTYEDRVSTIAWAIWRAIKAGQETGK